MIPEIAGSNLAEGMDVRLLGLLCFVQVSASATSWSRVQMRSTICVSNFVWSLNLKTKLPNPELGCSFT